MLYVYQTTVAAWENDRNEPSISAIVKLARYYNVHVDHLLGLDDTSVYDLWGVQEA